MKSTDVRRILSRHLLVEGFEMVLDLEKSEGSWFVDQRNGDRYLDFFSMYAAMPLGFNHPKLLSARDRLGSAALHKPCNSDVYTEAMAEFVDTFSRAGIPEGLPHAFFIEGGAAAVENALKTAFDWKVRRNLSRGRMKMGGSKVIHFRQAFHGRSGYCLSLTNTFDPRKTKYFPRFDWPRIVNPKASFPLDGERLEEVKALEKEALGKIEEVIAREGDEIAALIIEPIQGEGGDNHFRAEFLRALRTVCDESDVMYIMDEVQTGVGITGRFWAHEHFDVTPDILCFGKKMQVCGILASRRVDEAECNVFAEKSRISSTFGGNLVDMVRCTHVLRIIEEDGLLENARDRGDLLLTGIRSLAGEFPQALSNPRGRGLMCAFDLPDNLTRDRLVATLLKEKLLVVGSGERSVRFRPHLVVTAEEIGRGLETIRTVLKEGVYMSLRLPKDACYVRGT